MDTATAPTNAPTALKTWLTSKTFWVNVISLFLLVLNTTLHAMGKTVVIPWPVIATIVIVANSVVRMFTIAGIVENSKVVLAVLATVTAITGAVEQYLPAGTQPAAPAVVGAVQTVEGVVGQVGPLLAPKPSVDTEVIAPAVEPEVVAPAPYTDDPTEVVNPPTSDIGARPTAMYMGHKPGACHCMPAKGLLRGPMDLCVCA